MVDIPPSPCAPPKPRRFWLILGVQVAALAVLVSQLKTISHLTLVGVRQGPGWIYILQPDFDDRVFDFYQEWASARNWHVGRPIYTSHDKTFQPYLGIDETMTRLHGVNYNAHPPVSVLLVLPLGYWDDYYQALLFWHALMIVCFVASAVLVGREYGFRPSRAWWPWVLPTLAALTFWVPLREQFLQGQLTPLLLLLITGAWVCGRRGAPGWAGALLGMAAAIKLFPAFLLLYFVLHKQWRAVVVAGVVFVGLTLLSWGAFGTATFQDYVNVVLPSLKKFRSSGENQSIVGFWHRLFIGTPEFAEPFWYAPKLAWAGILGSAALLVGLAAGRLRQATTVAERDRGYWLLVTVMVLLGPLSWMHSPLLLTVPLGYLAVAFWRRESRTWATWLIIPVVAVWLLDVRVTRFFVTDEEIIAPIDGLKMMSLPHYALLLFFIATWCTLRERTVRSTAPVPPSVANPLVMRAVRSAEAVAL